MQLDPQLVFRILSTIESWGPPLSERPPIEQALQDVDRQLLLGHVGELEDGGYIRASVNRRVGGQVEAVVVYDLKARGREELAKLRANPPSERYLSQAVEFAVGGEDPPTSTVDLGSVAAGAGNHTLQADPGEFKLSGRTASLERTEASRRAEGSPRIVVVLQIETVLLLVRDEIQARRGERFNDDDELRTLEEIETEAEKLRSAAYEVESGTAPPESEIQAAKAFSEVVRKWLESDQALEVASGSCKLAIFLLSTSICASLGVLPTAAAAISGALVGGKTVVDAIKVTRPQKD